MSVVESSRGRGTAHWQPPSRSTWSGRGRARGRGAATHHHRTLVINNTNSNATGSSTGSLPSTSAATGLSSAGPTSDIKQSQTTTTSGWVAKRDRHMQWINSSVYDKEVQARTKAMAKTLDDKLQRKEAYEKLKLNRFLQDPQGHSNREVEIGGERYRVTAGGSKLVRLSGNSNVTTTPKKAVLGGVQFQRSRNGNLWRAGLVRASRRSKLSQRKSMPCKYFSNSGQCKHGLSCPYVHNPNEVAICPRFLASDSCQDGDMCDLSHDPTPHRVPACHHFLRGNCSKPDCRYAHVRVNPGASVCRRFATLGYCPKGADCTERHVHECPEFDETGVCTDEKCKLPHIERAGRRRAAAAATAIAEKAKSSSNDDSSFNSSDEDDIESIGSDVDSDVLSDVDFVRLGEENEDDDTLLEDFIKF
ncbi:hypothetical protein BDD12DRAFT_831429 [Trichophaea hybrida]|nr:hypothetical protein BDD12DRAFT_831429 [Trichophaea hybrida]